MTNIINEFTKGNDEVLDYKFSFAAKTSGSLQDPDVSDWLQSGETIDSYNLSVSAVTSGCVINIVNDYFTDGNTSVVAYISGGDIDKSYYLDCLINTSSSPIARVCERSIKINVVERRV